MLNGVSDFINQNRLRSSVRVTVVALSTALDASGSHRRSTAPSHTNAGRCPPVSPRGQGTRPRCVYDDAFSRYVAGSDGQKLIFWVKLLLQLVS